MIPEEGIILRRRVRRSDCEHGEAEFHIKQVQGEASSEELDADRSPGLKDVLI